MSAMFWKLYWQFMLEPFAFALPQAPKKKDDDAAA